MAKKPTYGELEQRIKELEGEVLQKGKVEEALRESEERFRALAEQSLNMVFINKKGKVVYANRLCKEIMGFKRSEFYASGFDFHSLIAPESVGLVKSSFKRHMEGQEVKPFEYTLLDKEGKRIEALITTKLIQYEGERAILGIVSDVTDRKRAEEALRRTEDKYRSILEGIEEGYFETDITGNFTFFNDSICRAHGYTRGDLKGMSYRELMDEENAEKVYQAFNKVYETGRPFKGLIYEIMRKDGSKMYVEVSVSLIKDSEGQPTGFRGMARDITERRVAEEQKRQLETQLYQAQKMEAIGTLAGGIAHDFNNLLMGIQGNASLMLLEIESNHPHYERLKHIERHVQSGADLTRRLLGFARGGKYEVKPTILNDIVKKSSEMFGRTKKEITIRTRYQADIWTVEVDRGQIEQILLNLYVNAWQAMPGGGELYVQTQNVTLSERFLKPFGLRPGHYVKIAVSDTGVGMDKKTQEKIFDPFFTTKERARGTGLGLASVYGIVQNHGGVIKVYSEKGEGTTFSIYLPASENKIAQEEEIIEEIPGGKETILLVDDEEMIIEVGKQLLEKMGYEVLVARNGKEAIEKIGNTNSLSPQPALVVLDMIMPEVGGGETYDRIKEINPGIKVLLSSGYSLNDQAKEILERGCNGFIQKPFNARQLSQKIREILN